MRVPFVLRPDRLDQLLAGSGATYRCGQQVSTRVQEAWTGKPSSKKAETGQCARRNLAAADPHVQPALELHGHYFLSWCLHIACRLHRKLKTFLCGTDSYGSSYAVRVILLYAGGEIDQVRASRIGQGVRNEIGQQALVFAKCSPSLRRPCTNAAKARKSAVVELAFGKPSLPCVRLRTNGNIWLSGVILPLMF